MSAVGIYATFCETALRVAEQAVQNGFPFENACICISKTGQPVHSLVRLTDRLPDKLFVELAGAEQKWVKKHKPLTRKRLREADRLLADANEAGIYVAPSAVTSCDDRTTSVVDSNSTNTRQQHGSQSTPFALETASAESANANQRPHNADQPVGIEKEHEDEATQADDVAEVVQDGQVADRLHVRHAVDESEGSGRRAEGQQQETRDREEGGDVADGDDDDDEVSFIGYSTPCTQPLGGKHASGGTQSQSQPNPWSSLLKFGAGGGASGQARRVSGGGGMGGSILSRKVEALPDFTPDPAWAEARRVKKEQASREAAARLEEEARAAHAKRQAAVLLSMPPSSVACGWPATDAASTEAPSYWGSNAVVAHHSAADRAMLVDHMIVKRLGEEVPGLRTCVTQLHAVPHSTRQRGAFILLLLPQWPGDSTSWAASHPAVCAARWLSGVCHLPILAVIAGVPTATAPAATSPAAPAGTGTGAEDDRVVTIDQQAAQRAEAALLAEVPSALRVCFVPSDDPVLLASALSCITGPDAAPSAPWPYAHWVVMAEEGHPCEGKLLERLIRQQSRQGPALGQDSSMLDSSMTTTSASVLSSSLSALPPLRCPVWAVGVQSLLMPVRLLAMGLREGRAEDALAQLRHERPSVYTGLHSFAEQHPCLAVADTANPTFMQCAALILAHCDKNGDRPILPASAVLSTQHNMLDSAAGQIQKSLTACPAVHWTAVARQQEQHAEVSDPQQVQHRALQDIIRAVNFVASQTPAAASARKAVGESAGIPENASFNVLPLDHAVAGMLLQEWARCCCWRAIDSCKQTRQPFDYIQAAVEIARGLLPTASVGRAQRTGPSKQQLLTSSTGYDVWDNNWSLLVGVRREHDEHPPRSETGRSCCYLLALLDCAFALGSWAAETSVSVGEPPNAALSSTSHAYASLLSMIPGANAAEGVDAMDKGLALLSTALSSCACCTSVHRVPAPSVHEAAWLTALGAAMGAAARGCLDKAS